MAGNPADGAAAKRARSTEKHIFIFSLHAPSADLLFAFGKRPRRRVLKNVPSVHPERILDIDWAFAFDTRTAIARHCETIFNRLFQPLVYASEKSFLRLAPHVVVVSREQAPRRIESEQRHCMKSLFTQVRFENAVIGQRVAIHLARRLLRQSPSRGPIITGIHLLVAF